MWKNLTINEDSEELQQVKVFYSEESMEIEDKDVKKVHENLAHISSSRLWSMLQKTKRGKALKQSLLKRRIEEVIQKCEACEKNAKTVSKAKSTGLRATNFNERVAMDLTEWYNHYEGRKELICHFVDEFTPLSSAGLVNSDLRRC